MEFADPKWLNALCLVPVLAVWLVYGGRRRKRELALFTGGELGDPLSPGRSWRKGLLKSSLKIAGFVLLALAMARPQFGSHLVKVEREGIDLVIALDTSLSMMAEDMKPNRLERAKREIVDLIRGLKGDRVGIVAFAGDAFVLCPLTVDYNAALMFAQTADVDLVSRPGTAIDEAISKSVALFPQSGETDRVIILVTDGESHAGDPKGAAEKAGVNGVRIYTIGIGNPAGELIPIRGTDGSVDGYKKDAGGETVLTRLDETMLRAVAEITDGQYLPATREGLELKVLYREIAGMDKKTIEGEFMERKQDRFALFLMLSFVLLGAEVVFTRKGSMRSRGRLRPIHTGLVVATLLVAALLPASASAGRVDATRVKSGNQYFEAGEFEKALSLYREALGDTTKLPDNGEGVLYNQANALHMMGDLKEALAKYHESFTGDTLQAGRMLYNRGNTLLKMGKLEDAVQSYIQRHNLELALRMLEQAQQQQQQQNQDGEQNEDSKQEKSEQNQDQQQQQGDQQEQEQQQDQQESQPEQPDSTQQQQQQQQPDSSKAQPQQPDSMRTITLTKEDALRLLRLLEEQEKELQKAKRKAAFKRVSKSGKDW
jgi:Ca-activated chloride channel family protein